MNTTLRTNRSRGQGMTEYLIIVALMAISAIAVIRTTSGSMKVGFGKIADALQGREKARSYDEVTDAQLKGRNLRDFNTGVQGQGGR